MKEFVAFVIKKVVEHPDSIRISEIRGQQTVILEVRCHADDMGRVIGKNGKTIGAVRALLNSIAARHGTKAMLEVVE